MGWSEFTRPSALMLALAVGLLLTSGAASAAADETAPCTPTSADQPKKKRGGLGSLFAAAKEAGVGRALGTGGLGSGTKRQVLGAVAGTAIEAAANASAAPETAADAEAPPAGGCPATGSAPVVGETEK